MGRWPLEVLRSGVYLAEKDYLKYHFHAKNCEA